MRGPVVFLGSLFAVTILALGVFLPLHRERAELASAIVDRATNATSGRNAPPPAQIGKLAAALLDERESVTAVRAVALEFSPIDLIEIEGRSVEFPAAWKDVPRLLARLARREGLVFRSFAAVPAEAPDRCRISLEIAGADRRNEGR